MASHPAGKVPVRKVRRMAKAAAASLLWVNVEANEGDLFAEFDEFPEAYSDGDRAEFVAEIHRIIGRISPPDADASEAPS